MQSLVATSEPAPSAARETGAGGEKGRALTEADAVDIWIARWLRVRGKDLVARYGCDSRRLYEIWWGERHPASRAKAERLFAERYPGLQDRTVFGYRRIPKAVDKAAAQPSLFDRPGR